MMESMFSTGPILYVALALITLQICWGQSPSDGFMPGSSPATPNNVLYTCQKKAAVRPLNVTVIGRHARDMQDWCTTYQDVVPCLKKTLPSSSTTNDWFLKLVYNESIALRMSRSLCARFPYLANLTCVEESMPRVASCMRWSTRSAIDHFNSQFEPGNRFTEKKQRLASIYACIVTVATSGCFHRELLGCSPQQRKLMFDFYVLLSGQCREIAGVPEATLVAIATPTPTAASKTSKPILNKHIRGIDILRWMGIKTAMTTPTPTVSSTTSSSPTNTTTQQQQPTTQGSSNTKGSNSGGRSSDRGDKSKAGTRGQALGPGSNAGSRVMVPGVVILTLLYHLM